MNKAYEKYVEKTDYVSLDDLIKYFGPHLLKQFLIGKPTHFDFKVWVLASSTVEADPA